MSKSKVKRLFLFMFMIVMVFTLVFQTGCDTEKKERPSYYLNTADYGEIRDTMSDTWIAIDDLGRMVSTAGDEGVGELNNDKHILMFYYTWCLPQHVQRIYNNTEIIEHGLEKGLDRTHLMC